MPFFMEVNVFPVIKPHDLQKRISERSGGLILACLHKNASYSDQIKILSALDQEFGTNLSICLADQEFQKEFTEKLGFSGTPAYFIFFKGTEVGRFLGQAGVEEMKEFVGDHIVEDNQPIIHAQGRSS